MDKFGRVHLAQLVGCKYLVEPQLEGRFGVCFLLQRYLLLLDFAPLLRKRSSFQNWGLRGWNKEIVRYRLIGGEVLACVVSF